MYTYAVLLSQMCSYSSKVSARTDAWSWARTRTASMLSGKPSLPHCWPGGEMGSQPPPEGHTETQDTVAVASSTDQTLNKHGYIVLATLGVQR